MRGRRNMKEGSRMRGEKGRNRRGRGRRIMRGRER
jgi:hypothetical protein